LLLEWTFKVNDQTYLAKIHFSFENTHALVSFCYLDSNPLQRRPSDQSLVSLPRKHAELIMTMILSKLTQQNLATETVAE